MKKKTYSVAWKGTKLNIIAKGIKTREQAEKLAKQESYICHHDGDWEKYYCIIEV